MFPGARVGGIVLRDLRNATDVLPDERPVWTPERPDEALEPRLEAWNQAYRRMGVNPKWNRPSAAALLNQAVKRGTLAAISPTVDGYNKVSLGHLVPLGGYDLDLLSGDVLLTRAQGGEFFSPLPPGSPEQPLDAGEIVYRDEKRVLTRRWNFRDSAETAIQSTTTSALLCAELPDSSIPAEVLDAVLDDLEAEMTAIGGRVHSRFTLTASSPSFTIDAHHV
ncbi:B3/B4 domain-containing protein [Streptomyces sp. 900116325]